MTPLPAPPADPLHILQPTTLLALAAVAAGLLAMLLLLWLRHHLRRRARRAAPPPPTPATAPPARQPAAGIATRIRDLEEKILASKAFREGCHRLAMLIKTHLGQRTGIDVERMTSSEIERRFDDDGEIDSRIGEFMTGLSRRRYGRAEPGRRDFVAACEEARLLLAAGESRG